MSKLTPEQKEMYSHKELPFPKNPVAYVYLVFAKLFGYFFIGVGAVFLSVVVFPFIHIFVHGKEKFGIVARAYVSHTFRFFINMLRAIGVIRYKNDYREEMKNMHGKVVVLNHPSHLDFVFAMAFIPTATCIVRASLIKTPLGGVVKQAYIRNSEDFEEVCRSCKQLLDDGCNVMIFPEGTRTPRHGRNAYKKGAARIALKSGVNIQPIYIGGSDKFGLGKHNGIFSYNRTEQLFYDFKLLPEIDISEYKDLPEPIAAKRLTEKMEEVLVGAGQAYAENHPLCKTVNNI